MNEKTEVYNVSQNQNISPQNIQVMCDDRCCGHCSHYEGNGYCCDGTPVTADYCCKDFKWAKY